MTRYQELSKILRDCVTTYGAEYVATALNEALWDIVLEQPEISDEDRMIEAVGSALNEALDPKFYAEVLAQISKDAIEAERLAS